MIRGDPLLTSNPNLHLMIFGQLSAYSRFAIPSIIENAHNKLAHAVAVATTASHHQQSRSLSHLPMGGAQSPHHAGEILFLCGRYCCGGIAVFRNRPAAENAGRWYDGRG